MADLTSLLFQHVGSAPIIPNQTGVWDETDVANPHRFWDPVRRRHTIAYSAFSASRYEWSLALAYSFDRATWTQEPQNPVMRPRADLGEGYICCNGSVEWFAGQYQHWYQIESASEIRRATSPDLINWTRTGAVINPPAGYSQVFDPSVRPRPGYLEMVMGATIAGQQSRRVLRSTSTDGATWTTPQPYAVPQVPGYLANPGEPAQARFGSLAILTHDGGPSATEVYGSVGRRINLQISLDGGVTWPQSRGDILPLPSWGTASCFDSEPDPDPASGLLHLYFAAGSGPQADQGMRSQIGHAVARLPWFPPHRRSR